MTVKNTRIATSESGNEVKKTLFTKLAVSIYKYRKKTKA